MARDENPCIPSPCGPNSQCRVVGTQNQQAACSCLPGYLGSAPNCRPECTTNSECPTTLACVNEKCVSPCVVQNPCAPQNAECSVHQHSPVCKCYPGYEGDPLIACRPALPPRKISIYLFFLVLSSIQLFWMIWFL